MQNDSRGAVAMSEKSTVYSDAQSVSPGMFFVMFLKRASWMRRLESLTL